MLLELKLLKYQKLVNRELKRFIEQYLSNYVSKWDKMFQEEMGNFILEGGKRLRPILATIIYEGTGGKDIESFAKLSLSAEILHNSTLIHDDIIDESDIRRGKSSFHKEFEKWFTKEGVRNPEKESEGMAILAGDYLNFLALQSVLDSNFPDAKKLYTIIAIRKAAETVIKGQILDSELVNMNAKESDYIKLIEMKTASVFEFATKVATILSDAEPNISRVLSQYAKNIGCAFQIQDDILGIFGKQTEIGKPLTSDLAESKKTILMIKAYENSNGLQRKILDEVLGNKNITTEDIERIKKILRETQSLEYAKELANKYSNEALRLLGKIEGKISNDMYQILHKLPTFITNRNY